MNEKPGLEPGFFARRAAGGLTGLRVAPGAEHMLGGLIVSTSNRHDCAI